MTSSPRPDNWQELLAGYALGDLSPEEAETLKQLLDTHPDLHQEMAQLQEVLALMPYGLPPEEPPSHLREAILQQARSEPKISYRRSPQFWWGLGGAVAALVIGALALDNYRLRQENTAAQALIATLKQPNLQLFSLQGTGEATQASGSLVVNQGQQVVIVLVQNLPQLPADRVYRLWAIEPGQAQPIFYGEFNSGTANQTNTSWQAPAVLSKPPEKMLITVEKASDPPIPAGDLVMQSSL
ncbi:anti-sigma factor [Leptolyngbya ohadii]|uniref:anti-sigma factor n=1 Tax=Leptolyngbya ohadii TaxID=1962290 RepID=UPI0011798C57|nr:anti-sigma factor [Leptolyngbya ohadii]